MEKAIRRYALANAVKFGGKASSGAIVGRIIGEFKDKGKSEIAKEVDRIVSEINKLSLDEQKKLILEIDPAFFDNQKEQRQNRKEQRKELPELKNAVMGKLVTRIAPEPSKYNHLGHAVSFILNYMYKLKYDGRCIIRFEDTNPEKESQEFVDAMQEDVIDYLGIDADDVVFVSDHMDKYYAYAEQLIDKGHAFTCRCMQEDISRNRRDMKECSCRSRKKEDIKKDWDGMKCGSFKEGEITLRMKIDMQHKNAVMRDPVIFRLCYARHYRQGDRYKVWPMYDFENSIEEGLLGITHILRSNEFETRIELQDYIRSLFDLPNPEIRQYARFNVTGAVTKGREIRALIESGDYIGWDDPRLVTLRALKRRGIVKEAFYELAKVIGMSKTNSNLDFSVIASINRKLLDVSAPRFFFVEDPVELFVKDAPDLEVELDIDPNRKLGGRKFNTHQSFLVAKKDFDSFKDEELVRLIDCLNFIKKKDSFMFEGTDINTFRNSGKKIIHWLPQVENLVSIEILMPDNIIIKGLAEETVLGMDEGTVCQFERFGFARLDSRKDMRFWFAHR